MRRTGAFLFLCMLLTCSRNPSALDPFCSVGTEELNTAFDTWGKMSVESGRRRPVHEGRGNLLAPRALLDGRCEMGSMSAPMDDRDLDLLRQKYGSIPTAVPVAVDALAIIAHSATEPRALSFADLETLFHTTPDAWPAGFPSRGKLRVFGLNSASDLYRFFKDKALSGRRISDRVTEVGGPLSLVDQVASTPGAVGYARAVHADNRVKILPLLGKTGPVLPEAGAVRSGRYPLSRFLYIYVRSDRMGRSSRDFLEFVLSDRGQAVLPHFGLVPLGDKERTAALESIRSIPDSGR